MPTLTFLPFCVSFLEILSFMCVIYQFFSLKLLISRLRTIIPSNLWLAVILDKDITVWQICQFVLMDISEKVECSLLIIDAKRLRCPRC